MKKEVQAKRTEKSLSDDGVPLSTNVWGPMLWEFMFSLAFKCPTSSYIDLQHMFILLEHVLPCSHCRRSYAMFRKEVQPTSVIKASVPDSAAVWLWVQHDMCNQKLGKICISFEELRKRHIATTMLTSDLNAIDIYCMMAVGAKRSIHTKVVDFIEVSKRLMKQSSPLFKLPTIMESVPDIRPECLLNDLHKIHERVYEVYGLHPLSKPAFEEKYLSAAA